MHGKYTMSIFDLYAMCEASGKVSMRCDKSVEDA